MSYISNKLLDYFIKNKIIHKTSVNLSSYSYFKSGGIADLIIYPNNQDELINCINILNQNKTPFKVIGKTTNILFLDDNNYTCFICTEMLASLIIDHNKKQIISECGTLLSDLSRFALFNSVTGLEGLEGIPGTVGAAVFMNAGAYGDDIKKTLLSVDVILPDGSLKKYNSAQLKLSYRNSIFRIEKSNEIIVRCYFKCCLGDEKSIYNKMSLYHNKRHKYQEWMYPNLGSIFSGSIYRSLAKKDLLFKLVSSLYYLLLYKWKPFRRESPDNRIWLNNFAIKRFNIKYDIQPFSDKDLNTLINKGQNTSEFLNYIKQIKNLIGDEVPIENEIIYKF